MPVAAHKAGPAAGQPATVEQKKRGRWRRRRRRRRRAVNGEGEEEMLAELTGGV